MFALTTYRKPTPRLIAAAPELLAMVKDYAENADCGSNREHADEAQGFIPVNSCWHCKAVELVAKAEGNDSPGS